MADPAATDVIAQMMADAMAVEDQYRRKLAQTPGIGQMVGADPGPQSRMPRQRQGLGFPLPPVSPVNQVASYVAHSGQAAALGFPVVQPSPVHATGVSGFSDVLLGHIKAGAAFPDNPDPSAVTVISPSLGPRRSLLDRILRRR